MTSSILIAAVGFVYAIVAADQFFKGNSPMAITWAGYAFAQIGLWQVSR